MKCIASAAVSALLAAGPWAARGADRYFVGPTASVWNNPANWSATPGGAGGVSVPTDGDRAFLTSNMAGGRSTALGPFAYAGSGLAQFDIDAAINEEQFLQTDPASHMIGALENVGVSGTGRHNQTDGTNTISDTLSLGRNAGSLGTYNLTSNGSLTTSGISFTGPVQIGVAGTGDFQLGGSSATFTVNGGNISLGVLSGGSGGIRHEGGTLTMTNTGGSPSLFIGRGAGATGSYTMSGTAGACLLDNTGGDLYAGYNGRGTFNQTAGTVHLHTGYVFIANAAGSTGSYTIGSGALMVDNGDIDVGGSAGASGGAGSFTANAGAVVSVGQYFRTWTTGASTINGGAVTVTGDTTVDAAGTLTITGGTLNTLGTPNALGLSVTNGGTVHLTGGTINTGRLIVDGTVNNNGGTVNISSYVASVTGTGAYNQTAGTTTLANATDLQSGLFHITGGTVTSNGVVLVGNTTNNGAGNANLSISNSAAVSVGVLGVGNNGTVSGGSGSGVVTVAGNSTLYADTVLLGGPSGSGDMTISDNAAVTIGGGFMPNDATINGGSLKVLDQNPPGGEDPELNRSIVGGYLHNGALNVNGGAVTSPNIKLGITSGNAGTFSQTGGSVSTGILGVGNDASLSTGSGVGIANISGGTTTATYLIIGSTAGGQGMVNLGAGAAVTVNNLQIAPTGLLNAGNSALTINYGSSASPNAAIRNYISNGYHGAALWTGATGITSTNAAANPAHFSVAFANGSDGVVTNLPAGITSFAPGGTLAAGAELITYARAGDANLDGKVDFADFIVLSNHFGTADINWDHGNFNYDGIVDFADFIILSNDFGAGVMGGNGSGATPAELAQYNALAEGLGIAPSQIAAWDVTIAALPEPGSVGLLAIGGLALLKRRRNRMS